MAFADSRTSYIVVGPLFLNLSFGRYLQNNQFTGSINVLASLPLENLWVTSVSVKFTRSIDFYLFAIKKLHCSLLFSDLWFSGMLEIIVLQVGSLAS
jgi:hypothetical protein